MSKGGISHPLCFNNTVEMKVSLKELRKPYNDEVIVSILQPAIA